MAYTLPALPYGYDALEPHFDEETMRIHHTKHHQTYVKNINDALKDNNELSTLDVQDLMTRFNDVPADKKPVVRNHGGGHANHSFFWKNLTPNNTALADGPLKSAIEKAFGSYEAFQQAFEKAATSVFGSGWAWLILKDGALKVVTTANQDSPLMGESVVGASAGYPIIGLDVWEHAYYLKYRNLRPDYIKSYWKVVNWEYATERYKEGSS
ncbi:hypothetical protein LTS10_003282 [Elasticomyces elasticus]|nr:hypothetical protein LTS10_003282 [Elasticomyces elasticus]